MLIRPLRSVLSSLYISCPTDLGQVKMIPVNYFIPYYVNDVQSDIRGIKFGWYTMDERGRPGTEPAALVHCVPAELDPTNVGLHVVDVVRNEIIHRDHLHLPEIRREAYI